MFQAQGTAHAKVLRQALAGHMQNRKVPQGKFWGALGHMEEMKTESSAA